MQTDKALEAARRAIQGKKVLVLGSSPNLVLPKDYDESWCLITVNASGRSVEKYGLGKPDLTVMAVSVLLKAKPEFDEVRANLSGLESGATLVRFLSGGRLKRSVRTYRASRVLKACGYKTDDVIGFAPEVWKNLIERVMGEADYGSAKNISTGVFCVILAFSSGAQSVTTSGIDPSSMGHAYSDTDFAREHINSDIRALSYLRLNHHINVLI